MVEKYICVCRLKVQKPCISRSQKDIAYSSTKFLTNGLCTNGVARGKSIYIYISVSLVCDHVLRSSYIILVHSSGIDLKYLTAYLRNLTLVVGV